VCEFCVIGGVEKESFFLYSVTEWRFEIFIAVCLGLVWFWVCLWYVTRAPEELSFCRVSVSFSKNISLTRPYSVVWFILQLLIFLSKNYKNLFATLCFLYFDKI